MVDKYFAVVYGNLNKTWLYDIWDSDPGHDLEGFQKYIKSQQEEGDIPKNALIKYYLGFLLDE